MKIEDDGKRCKNGERRKGFNIFIVTRFIINVKFKEGGKVEIPLDFDHGVIIKLFPLRSLDRGFPEEQNLCILRYVDSTFEKVHTDFSQA